MGFYLFLLAPGGMLIFFFYRQQGTLFAVPIGERMPYNYGKIRVVVGLCGCVLGAGFLQAVFQVHQTGIEGYRR